ncbi:hypothetical protein DRJ16_01175 [Candidatus Woesearchaeota archaeon]|nr:MAG: hypothetical protein DRJ16_01175 [Candidatus Woesearchaeota archaeon]
MLDKLAENRVPILLAEIGSYLHDLGKARREFIEYYSKDINSGWDTDKHNFPSVFPEELRIVLNEIKVSICGEEVSLMDFIEKHHPEKETNDKRKDCEILPPVRLLYAGWNGYDGMDSGLDKGRVMRRDKVGQRKDHTFIATAFGYEFKRIELSKIEDLTKNLQEVVINALEQFKSDNDIIKLRKVMEKTKEYYLNFLGETRRPANDVTLWDHSYSVATLVKCAVAKNIIDCSNASFDPLDFNWKVFSVNFDTLGLLTKGVKLGDILGYWECIKRAFKRIKEIIEVEYPIGNEIYRDTTGIFFLVPDIELGELKSLILKELENIEPEFMPQITIEEVIYLDSDYKFTCGKSEDNIPKGIYERRKGIEERKKEELKNSLPIVRKTALQGIIYPTSSARFFYSKFSEYNWKNKEICPICRLRPMDENSDGCEHCLDRRKSRAEIWRKDPKDTIWLDEVSDHNDRVALIVGCFVLDEWLDGSLIKTLAIRAGNNVSPESKNSSPARIRRCWETTEKFIQSTIFEEILENWKWKPDIRRQRIQFKIEPNPDVLKGATCDIDVDGVRFSPVCIDRENGIFVSTTNLEILKKFGESANEISENLNRRIIKVKTEKDRTWKDGKILEARPADEKFQDYLPYVKIYDFPDQFMGLVPAYEAFDIAERILEEYEIQFSKVRERLPFHIGIIGFHRRTPLYVVMDAGKRLLDAFKRKTKTESAKVKSIHEACDCRFGNYLKEIEIEVNNNPLYSIPLKWKISYSTGDPDQEDRWHPYIRVGCDVSDRNLCFDYTGKGNYVVHVKEIKENDKIKIDPSYFRLFYLENAADRFIIDEDLKPLDHVHYIKNLWKEIENRLKSRTWSTSQIYTYWGKVKKKRENYDKENFKKFVKAALTNFLGIGPQKDKELFDLLFQGTMDCSLDLCLYWNFQVRKAKLKGGEKNERI